MNLSYNTHAEVFKIKDIYTCRLPWMHTSIQKYDVFIKEYICDKASKTIKMLIIEGRLWVDKYIIMTVIFL